MRQITVDRFGGPEVLQMREVPVPSIGAHEVLIRTHAIGINFFEVLLRQDRYAVHPKLPFSPGIEAAGIVEAAGSAADVRPGSRVLAPLFVWNADGAYADFVKAPANEIIHLPDEVPFDTGVALLTQGLTALYSINKVPPGSKTVLVTAAAGGVGSLLVQLAKRSGAAHVIAVVGSENKAEIAASLGADTVFNHRRSGWEEECQSIVGKRGVDIAYDLVGGDLTHTIAKLLSTSGQLVFGALGRFSVGMQELNSLFQRDCSVQAIALIPSLAHRQVSMELAELLRMIVAKELKVIIGGRFPLTEAAAAHRLLESGESVGKVVLVP